LDICGHEGLTIVVGNNSGGVWFFNWFVDAAAVETIVVLLSLSLSLSVCCRVVVDAAFAVVIFAVP